MVATTGATAIIPSASSATTPVTLFAEQRAALIKSFDPRALAWLALLPTWTEHLALACHFPVGSENLEELLVRMEMAGLCSRSDPPEPLDDSPDVPPRRASIVQERYFWMPAADRTEHVGRLMRDPGATFLRGEAWKAAESINAAGREVFVPKTVREWSELVERDRSSGSAAAWLTEKARELIKEGATGEALDLLTTGKELASILGGTLEGTVARGNRWVELVYRRKQDERLLKDFVERTEEIKEVEKLLLPSAEHWALHFVGPGGVGKSMLVRYITSRLASQRKIAVARIDFDHLSPEYPLRRPGQLLSALADELQSFSLSTRQDKLAEEFQQRVLQLHEAISGPAGAVKGSADPVSTTELKPEADPLVSTRRAEFQDALDTFCDLLLPLPAPVLLILDTCEELAKLTPSGAMLPSLMAAFDMLEYVHKKVPSVRVIFAGRRLLALSGEEQPNGTAGWYVDEAATAAKGHLPKCKSYLRIHQLRGFDREDSETLLHRKSGRELDDAMKKAVLARSREPSAAIPILRVTPEAPDLADERYNPFDLALYGDWLGESPQLTAAEISSGIADPYVELRIVKRIKHAIVRAVLPAAILLRRFDKDMLQSAMPLEGNTDEVFRELGDMEWINYQSDQALGTAFLEIDRNFYQRVWQYFDTYPRREEIDRSRTQLRAGLARQVRERALRELGVDHIDATLRLLPAEEAAVLWDNIERRVPSEADWSWARSVTERVLGEDGAAAPSETAGGKVSPLRAAVRATHTAAMIQNDLGFDAREAWKEVEDTVDSHPVPGIKAWLRQRAKLGRVTAQFFAIAAGFLPAVGTAGVALNPSDVEVCRRSFAEAVEELRLLKAFEDGEQGSSLAPDQMAQLRGCFAAAWEHVLDVLEVAKACSQPGFDIPSLNPQIDTAAIPLAYRMILDGRAAMLAGRDRRMDLFHEALDEALDPWKRPVPWADWRAPSSLRDRIRLEVLRCLPISEVLRRYSSEMAQWLAEAGTLEQLRSIDSERLVSIIIGIQSTGRPLDWGEIVDLANTDEYRQDRRATAFAHCETRPLFVALARAITSIGDAESAFEILEAHLADASETGNDGPTVRLAQREIARTIRRMRLYGRSSDLLHRLVISSDPDDVSAAWQVFVTAGGSRELRPAEPIPESPTLVHAAWQCLVSASQETVAGYRERLYTALDQSPPKMTSLLQLDVAEAHLLDVPSSAAERLVFRRPERDVRLAEAEGLLRSLVRMLVLSGPIGAIDFAELGSDQPLLAAEVAVEEAELLALRLPQRAKMLFDFAYERFKLIGHAPGALVAAIGGVIAAVRAGEKDKAIADLENKVRPTYQDFAPTASLPSWESIVSWSEAIAKKTDAPERMPSHPDWADWLNRLIRARTAVTAGMSPDAEAATHSWIAQRYSEPWPPELDLPHPTRRLTWSRITSVAFDVAVVVTSLATLVGIIAGLVYLANLGITKASAGDGLGAVWPLVLAMLIFGALCAGVAQVVLESLRDSWSSVRLRVKARSQKRTSSRSRNGATSSINWLLSKRTLRQASPWLRFRMTPSSRDDSDQPPSFLFALDVGLPFRWEPAVQLEADGVAPSARAYGELVEVLPPVIVKELAGLLPRSRRRPLRVALDIPPALSDLPWEAVLAVGIQLRSEKPLTRADLLAKLQPWRCGDALPGAQQGRAADSARITEVRVVSRGWDRIGETGWSKLDLPVVTGPTMPSGRREADYLLHVIGSVVESLSGRRLKTESSRRAGKPSGFSDPTDAPTLVIVQGEPDDSMWQDNETPLQRLDTERERAAALRSYGADLFAAGAWAVIVLPGLPPKLATKLVEIIAEEMRKDAVRTIKAPTDDIVEPDTVDQEKGEANRRTSSTPEIAVLTTNRDAVFRAVTYVRKAIESWTVPDWAKEARAELALDVCLFARYTSTVLGKTPRVASKAPRTKLEA
ncbi:ATP-binding protein [Bradyrhizobium sp. UFLA05-109]